MRYLTLPPPHSTIFVIQRPNNQVFIFLSFCIFSRSLTNLDALNVSSSLNQTKTSIFSEVPAMSRLSAVKFTK